MHVPRPALLACSFAFFVIGCGGSSGDATTDDAGHDDTIASDAPSGSDAPLGTDTAPGSDAPPGTDSAPTDGATPPPSGRSTLAQFMGVNALITDPIDKLAAIGNVREYHDWQWCEGNGDASYPGYPSNQNSFSLWGGYWDFDAYYQNLGAKGVFAFPVIQGGVKFVADGKVPPVAAGKTATDPAAYVAHADHLFQYAARYGHTKVDDKLLKLASDQKRLTGLGTLGYIEDFNEQDASWILPGGRLLFNPDEYAAMASADYDADQGRLGKTLGVKNADPTMKMVMGGLAGEGNDIASWEKSIETYLDGIRTWATAHRGGSFPADVVNVHYYSFGPDPFGTAAPRPAVSPEDDKVRETMSLLKKYRDDKLPGKELWITEFGYDTDPLSRLHAPSLGKNSAMVVQGQWLVRYYLALLGAGFDRAFMFILDDPCDGTDCHVQFGTSGITTGKDKWDPKPGFYFLATLRARLGAYAFHADVASGDPNVRILELVTPGAGAKTAYVVWAPTSKDTTVSGYTLSLGSATKATLVTLTDKAMNGTETSLGVSSGKAKLDVTETPSIVLVE